MGAQASAPATAGPGREAARCAAGPGRQAQGDARRGHRDTRPVDEPYANSVGGTGRRRGWGGEDRVDHRGRGGSGCALCSAEDENGREQHGLTAGAHAHTLSAPRCVTDELVLSMSARGEPTHLKGHVRGSLPSLAALAARARWDEYRRLIDAALHHGYAIRPVAEWLDTDLAERVLVLRHDVDRHPRSALRMLAIESEAGVRATWYFRWSTARPRVVRAVRETGAEIGLHYETLTRMLRRNGFHAGEEPSQELVERARLELRRELAAFEVLFGPMRSAAPHGDTRISGVSNTILLMGEDLAHYRLEYDANASLRACGPAMWLTDRRAADGGWRNGVDPLAVLADGVSPLLLVTHPNNWASGAALGRDRVAAGVLGRPPAAVGRALRTGSELPPST